MPAKPRSQRQRRNAGETETRPPLKLNRKVIEQLRTVLESGVYLETAAAYVGVHRDTLFDWMKRGRRDVQQHKRSIHRELLEAVEAGLATFEVAALGRIQEAGAAVWQADAWRLERRFPDRYGRRSRVDHGTPDGQPFPMRIDVSSLSDEDLDTLTALLEKGKPADAGTRRPSDT